MMARLLLAVLALLNLTVVCQGHDYEGRHTDYHLTFLGEPVHDEESEAFPASSVDTAHDGAHSFAMLGAALLPLLAAFVAAMRSLLLFGPTELRPQFSLSPLDPPPRQPRSS
jgi:hypothetical protein